MIRIMRIVGESYDLETGDEVGKSLLLSNGISTKQVAATEEMLQAVLLLFAEKAANGNGAHVVGTPVAPEGPPLEFLETDNGAPPQKRAFFENTEEDKDEPEAGEDYTDADTGFWSV